MHKCRSYRLATTNTRKGTLVCQSEAALPKCVWNQRVGRGYCSALPAVMARLGLKGEAYNWRKLGYFGGQAPLKPLEPGLLRIELTPRPPKKTYGILRMSFECQLTPPNKFRCPFRGRGRNPAVLVFQALLRTL